MTRSLSRRKRKILLTCALAGVFLAATGAVVWSLSTPQEAYHPGEPVDGLTAVLNRALPADHPHVTFVDVTETAGIDFRHFPFERTSRLPEDMGSGAAWGDYDNDGLPDLYVVNASAPYGEDASRSDAYSALYRNNGDGTFTDVSVEAGVDLRSMGMAAAWADFDNDGWLDLVVTSYGRVTLFRNNGDGTFTDVSVESGVGLEEGFWAGVAWGDYDRDGWLDLYVTGYVKFVDVQARTGSQFDVQNPWSINPATFAPERNLLFRNNGDGTFTEVALRAGVQNAEGKGLEAVWVDFDDDGWPDLYVANDVSDNVLFRNRGDGTFEDVTHRARVADYRGSMGLAIGDWDGDGDMDMFVTHWVAEENGLYNNLWADRIRETGGPGILQFTDVADRFGLGQISLDFVGWGTSFVDYDNEGRLDLFVVNGHTFQRRDDPTRLVSQRDQVFWNRGPEKGFFDVSSVAGDYFASALVGRGAAFADFDGDGGVDVFIVNHGGPPVLLRNEGGSRKAWVKIALTGTRSNRNAIGARIRLVAQGRTHVRQVGAQASYLSQNSLVKHFGLGDAVVIDTVEVRWPSGLVEIRTGLPIRRTIQWTEGDQWTEGEAL